MFKTMRFQGLATLLLVLVYSAAVLASASSGKYVGDESGNSTKGGESKWQAVKDEFQYIFAKISHFFKKDVPEKAKEVENFVVTEAAVVKKEVDSLENTIETEFKHIKFEDSCECSRYSCGCCQHLEEPSIHLNSTLCANATYLAQDIGISLTVTVNDYTIFNETVSVRNPPPVCLGVPYVKEWAEACLRLYDIDASKTHLHACAEVEARMKHVLIAKYELGCFDIGPITAKAKEQADFQLEAPVVVLV